MNKYKKSLNYIKNSFIPNLDTLSKIEFAKPFYQKTKKSLNNLEELIDNQGKYRWHDLRKNPNDLPIETGRKYIITQRSNEKYHVANWNGMYFGDWSTLFSEDGIIFSPFASVDKWKEIEELEDE